MEFMGAHDESMWRDEGFGYDGKRLLPEDFLLQGEVMSPLHKRSRTFFWVDQQQSHGSNEPLLPPSNPLPLHEESPLGLQLRKSPSLLELIQMRLSQENTSFSCPSKRGHHQLGNKDDKFKASNFTASRLRIGSWEFITKNAGCGLTAKFYFAKQKLIWEVLDGGLKFKIEMEWSDITALKANFPDDEPGTLTVVLSKQPLFFKETNPQPKKHTLWHSTSDFTGGQASTYRQHFLEFPEGVLEKHFEKLIRCDARLRLLSQLPQTVLDSSYFVTDASIPVNVEHHVDNGFETAGGSPISGLQEVAPQSVPLPTSSTVEQWGSLNICCEDLPIDLNPPMPGTHATKVCANNEVHNFQNLNMPEELDVSVLPPSIVNLVDEEEHFIPEQPISGNPTFQEKESGNEYDLEEIHKILFSDSSTSLDENFLMSKVNSFCNLIEWDQETDTTPPNSLVVSGGFQAEKVMEPNPGCEPLPENRVHDDNVTREIIPNDFHGSNKQFPGMSRKDSFATLLHNLPRVTSFPQLCFM